MILVEYTEKLKKISIMYEGLQKNCYNKNN